MRPPVEILPALARNGETGGPEFVLQLTKATFHLNLCHGFAQPTGGTIQKEDL